MTAKNQNFSMVAGDSKEIIVTIADVDLFGCTIKWVAKRRVSDAQHKIKKDNLDGVSITTASTFTITLKPSDTKGLSGSYYHEAEITDAVGNVSTIMIGSMSIERSGV